MRVLETREPPNNFVPKSILRRKLYELVERRNEWTDWHGSTGLVTRGSNYADLKDVDTREVLLGLAEQRRKQGSVFSIRVMPALVLQNDCQCLLVGERRTDKPLAGLMKHRGLRDFEDLPWAEVFGAFLSFTIRRDNGFILSLEERGIVGRLERFDAENPCFNFRSYPAGRAASLCWGRAGSVSTGEFDKFLVAVRRKKARDKERRRLKASNASSSGSSPA